MTGYCFRLGPLIGVAAFGAVLLIAGVFFSLGRAHRRRRGEARIGPLALVRHHAFARHRDRHFILGTAEPIYHLNAPPDFAGCPRSEAAAEFALSYALHALGDYASLPVRSPRARFRAQLSQSESAYSLSGTLGLSMGLFARGAGRRLSTRRRSSPLSQASPPLSARGHDGLSAASLSERPA
ncbi:MAG: hypothetical protein R3C42_08770 [Parvularculaceae bacterium]